MTPLPRISLLAISVVFGFADHPFAAERRPLAPGPVRYVDAAKGDDQADGSEQTPWRSIQHAVDQLTAGDTLCLRGGIYYENVRCSLAGTAEKPITIRSHPGERAILDGGFREFLEKPEAAWVPVEDGAPGEYRSTRSYRNVSGVAGHFADSGIGLLTYWLLGDLRAVNEQWKMDPAKKIFNLNVYCGPGIWYDSRSGHIHCRLAHTHNDLSGAGDYRGGTDPRTLPLVIAPLHSVPLLIDRATHVRFQDLEIRGGGEETVLLRHASGVEIDGLIVRSGGITGHQSGPVKLTHSAIHGRIPPWMWRIDSSKGCASGATRDIARMITPTLLELSHHGDPDALPRVIHEEILSGTPTGLRQPPFTGNSAASPQMIHFPANHDWDISWCEFTDGHDGIFLAGKNMRFHHNFVESMQDDAIDIGCALPDAEDTMYVTENLIRHCLTAISTHNYNIHWPRGKAWIARNVIDQRRPIMFGRASDEKPGDLKSVGTFLMHGSDAANFVESVHFYQNTCIAPTSGGYAFAHRTMFHLKPGSARRVFNNLFVYLNDNGIYPKPFYGLNATEMDLQIDGNLHWNPHPDAKEPPGFFEPLRTHPLSEFNKRGYPAGFGAHDFIANPRFVSFDAGPEAANDYRLEAASPAIGKGVPLPADWPDPLRPADGARPDIGALPSASGPPQYGVQGRIGF